MHKLILCLFPLYARVNVKSPLTDEEVVDAIRQQNDSAMVNVLYSRYADKVYRKCYSFVKDEAAAEDLAHDVFIKVLLNLNSFSGRSKFSSWLYSVTYNFCIDYLRRKQRYHIESIDNDNSAPVNIADIDTVEDLNHIKSDRLKLLLEKVKTEEKMILLMKYADSMSIKEIQEALNLSESAVKMRIKRAKEKILDLYETTSFSL